MEIDEDHFPPMASVNTTSFDIRALIESKKEGKLSPRKVWVPKYCLVRVDRLKKEWATVCTDPPSDRNSVKGIQQGTEQHNQFSKKVKLSPRGKMNPLEDEFVPLREKVIEKPTPPWGRFISPRNKDVVRFRECCSRKRAFSPRGKFNPLNDKIVGKANSPGKKVGKRHVYPLKPVFPKVGPISPRYRMNFTRGNFTSPRGRFFSSRENIADNFTSPRNLTGERHVPPAIYVFLRDRPDYRREEIAEKENPMRCIIPPMVSPSQRWHVVQHKKFPQRLSRTQKTTMQSQRAADRRQLIDVPVEIQKEDAIELENVKEGMVPSLEKTKFRRKATEDMESMSSVDEVMYLEALMLGEILISLICSTISLTLPTIFKSKKIEEDLVEVEGKEPTTKEDVGHVGVTIESSEECRPQKVILEKHSMEMTRHIKPLYVRAHLNGILVSKVLIDNGLAVSVMPLRILRALGRSINDLIETEVVVFAFTEEVSKTLRILPIDITIGSKTTLSAFFVIDSIANYNILLGRD